MGESMAAKDPALEARFLERYEEAKRLSVEIDTPALAERIAALPAPARARILGSLTRQERARLLYTWAFWARGKQIVRADIAHLVALFMAGRGFGKTRTAAEHVRARINAGVRKVLLIGPTLTEILRYMVGGQYGEDENSSGILDVFPPAESARIVVKEQKGEIHFPTGAVAHLVSDEQPELRGGGYELAWCDEIAKWRHLQKIWDNLVFSMRTGEPEIIVTTTPRPMRFLRELVADPDTVTVLGTSDENERNLARGYIPRLARKYGNTRTGRQERGGELLTETEGALFHPELLEAARVTAAPTLARIVVSIDPAISTKPDNDETGILAMGLGHDGHIYVLADASGKHSPEQWGAAALKLYDQWKADAFVGERNRGGDLVAANMRATVREKRGRNATVTFIEVHATRGKEIRAEPVGTLHELGRLHMVGVLPDVEREITEWAPALGGTSPNRLDALVWGAYELAKLGVEAEENFAEGFQQATQLGRELAASSATSAGMNLSALLGGGGTGGRI